MIDYELMKSEAKRLGIDLDQFGLDRFDAYAERLLRWNNHINLTAITEPDEIVIKHFIDSLYVLKYVDIPKSSSLIDIGCGAGFPAMPVLIARPDIDVTFVDSIGKKLGFIKDVLRNNGLVGTCVHQRAEDIGKDEDFREQYDFATARAVAPLNVLCEYCLPFVRTGGLFVSLKGSNAKAELDEARHAIEVLGGKLASFEEYTLPNGDKRAIIIIKKISQTPTKYPRRSKKIDTKPL